MHKQDTYSLYRKIVGSAASPSAEHLFKVRDEKEAKYLPGEQAQSFHHTTAHLLFMCSRARRDIQISVVFLTTRVKQPDEDDWGNLKKVLKYLNDTRYMKLKLTAKKISLNRWWEDDSYNVHWDSRGHNGAMMTLGKGAIISNSNKKKINVNSSTEGELVDTHDQLPDILHTPYFIEPQGYTIDKNLIYQAYQSTTRLEVNRRISSGNKTKHISSSFFFITDKIAKG